MKKVLLYSTANYMVRVELKTGALMLSPGQRITVNEADLPDKLPAGVSKISIS